MEYIAMLTITMDMNDVISEEAVEDAISTGIPPLTWFSLTRFPLMLFFYSDSQAIITVGGAATKCQHQSPCYDNNCKACYDPLLRIHGKCGGASYFTCRGSLPRDCMPYTCTYRVSYENSKFRFENLWSNVVNSSLAHENVAVQATLHAG